MLCLDAPCGAPIVTFRDLAKHKRHWCGSLSRASNPLLRNQSGDNMRGMRIADTRNMEKPKRINKFLSLAALSCQSAPAFRIFPSDAVMAVRWHTHTSCWRTRRVVHQIIFAFRSPYIGYQGLAESLSKPDSRLLPDNEMPNRCTQLCRLD
jgi:hypothetical protein